MGCCFLGGMLACMVFISVLLFDMLLLLLYRFQMFLLISVSFQIILALLFLIPFMLLKDLFNSFHPLITHTCLISINIVLHFPCLFKSYPCSLSPHSFNFLFLLIQILHLLILQHSFFNMHFLIRILIHFYSSCNILICNYYLYFVLSINMAGLLLQYGNKLSKYYLIKSCSIFAFLTCTFLFA